MATWARSGGRLTDARTGSVVDPDPEAALERSAEAILAAGLTMDGIGPLESSASPQRVQRQRVLFGEGEVLRHLYIVESGSFKLVRHSEEGKELIVALAGKNDSFGALAEPSESTVLARALEDSVVLAIPVTAIRRAMKDSVELSLRLVRRAEEMLRSAETQASRLAFESVPRRLANLLLEKTDEAGVLRFPLNQTELANLIGSSRETVCSLLNRFRREGVIETPAGQIRIRDRGRLESVD